MGMIKGITVTLISKTQVGTDGFNRPVYGQTEEDIENVLVSPVSSDDIISPIDLDGKKAVYMLGIPKTDTHDWTDVTVRFFGHTWKSFGFPEEGIDSLVPGEWNRKVKVELYG